MKFTRLAAASASLFAVMVSMSAHAFDPNSPVGFWKNISDKTGKTEAIIQIWDDRGEIHGKLVRLFDPKDTVCTKCPDNKKDKPLIGMEIIWGVHQDGGVWDGGHILDPDSGDIYRVKLSLDNGGQSLNVRGFIGFALLGRTQTWIREANAN